MISMIAWLSMHVSVDKEYRSDTDCKEINLTSHMEDSSQNN